MDKASDAKASGRFRGWEIVAAGFLSVVLTVGSTTYSFGLFVDPIAREFDLPRADVNLGLMLLLVGMTAWGPIVGRLIDRTSARIVIAAGAVGIALGFWAIAAASAPWVMAVAIFLPLSFGATACGSLGTSAVAARWFRRHRGRAIGILAVATSTGGFVIVPFMAYLVTRYGWRDTLLIQGVLLAGIIATASLLFIRNRPEDVGQVPDGGLGGPMEEEPAEDTASWSVAQLLRSRDFWLLGLGAGLLLGSDQALLASLIPYGIDRGFSTEAAALALSILTGSAILGKLIVSWLSDIVDKRHLFAVVSALNILFLGLLLAYPGYWTLLAGCALLGAAIGGVYPVWLILVASRFGQASFGSSLGCMFWISLPCALGSIRLAGEVRDRLGNYDLAFIIFIGLDILAALLIYMMSDAAGGRRTVRARAAAAAGS